MRRNQIQYYLKLVFDYLRSSNKYMLYIYSICKYFKYLTGMTMPFLSFHWNIFFTSQKRVCQCDTLPDFEYSTLCTCSIESIGFPF